MTRALDELRKEYTRTGLHESEVAIDPMDQFRAWFEEMVNAGLVEPNAMTLATATPDGEPSARIVLLKGYDERGFVFYTNFEGRKARELEANPNCTLAFYWGDLERQIRIEGRAARISSEESDAYFAGRPRGSQLGAWASQQSQTVDSREPLEERLRELEAEYEGRQIPRPPFWGGYRVEPLSIEFWQGRRDRLHDRIVYTRADGRWQIHRLQP
ncbi:pyridoxamine 5'-phosphate oxidase [soil metagenome]